MHPYKVSVDKLDIEWGISLQNLGKIQSEYGKLIKDYSISSTSISVKG
jgi:hypothetical protein